MNNRQSVVVVVVIGTAHWYAMYRRVIYCDYIHYIQFYFKLILYIFISHYLFIFNLYIIPCGHINLALSTLSLTGTLMLEVLLIRFLLQLVIFQLILLLLRCRCFGFSLVPRFDC